MHLMKEALLNQTHQQMIFYNSDTTSLNNSLNSGIPQEIQVTTCACVDAQGTSPTSLLH